MITKATNELSTAFVVLLFGRGTSETTLTDREKTVSWTFVVKEKEAAASYQDKQVADEISPFPNSLFGSWLGSFNIFTAEGGKQEKGQMSCFTTPPCVVLFFFLDSASSS
ncbi:hypothetical protein ILYODFUR_024660 [Ilyodon furcidens]|uniref:Uncharacterized protein n=1 Tax=Ilyodon furcidens TaxID=33524 RepID=A0ABV0SS42_9TELE